ncbi:MAG: precorrin-6y C5,15-methyltransferase (decarboxylating) subunit CbiE [Proteiniphilum sp.]|uniref:precorrin-6y C5,15-methyltransferase (decarboxylating) subunit CbiE n=1 Tax=Proteiniphilum sp. TaxID=1926877 RepID=UPI002ABBF5ED|nr:precorrin-6y C5,15-methyltransferase (decarboxylating) subunit CbiE [Proteiniphilum sp.]MDY9918331.1 precorrin-6y C5,15-methyltransferase (decarboxylating) subunit CbiE [Proteiniphilum sp.]
MNFFIIGIDDNREQYFTPEVQQVIQSHTLFSGGIRHYEIVKPYLPLEHSWIPITVPLSDVFEQYHSHESVVVFASGDPLFYGFANTVLREIPEAEVKVFPFFNSLQLLAHRLLMPYHNMHVVSLTGRSWNKFDEALIRGYEKIGILTDNKEHTPSAIAARMLEYGYDNYTMSVGELLGNGEKEKVSDWRLEEVVGKTFAFPNNLILRRTYLRPRPFGIPESDFHLLDGRARMITKMPIRLLSLSMLDLHDRHVFWDIGFCTGSVSVEAKLQFPHLRIIAFEQRPEGEQLIHDNARKFGTPGIETVIGDFAQIDITPYPSPDAVFIGGHGGKMDEIIEKTSDLLADDGVIVFNSVSEESRQLFLKAIDRYNLQLRQTIRIQTDDFNPIDVMKATK